jgi:TonB family protein
VIAFMLASLLAVPAMQDTTSALPGTPLRFGMESGRFGAAQGFQPTPRPQPPDRQERAGAMRFFGIDATATLSFLDRRLVQGDFVIENASPQQIGYIDDDLVRRGYRRQCTVRERERSQCTWTGGTRVEMSREGRRITATVRPLTREERGGAVAGGAVAGGAIDGAADSAVAAPDTMPMDADTLAWGPGAMSAYVETGTAPRYPDQAREAGVMGVVRMLALVDTTGAVIDVRITRSIPELDAAAIEALRQWRFRPFVRDGRRVGRWVHVPMVFTLH